MSTADEAEETVEHSPEATRTLAETIRDYLKEDDEGEYDVYDKIVVKGDAFVVRVTDDNLEYTVTIAPDKD